MRKGPEDMVCGGGDVYVLRERGSPRRCGGQGDILAGILGVSMYWASLSDGSALNGGPFSPSSSGHTTAGPSLSWEEFERSDLHAWRLPLALPGETVQTVHERSPSSIEEHAVKKQCLNNTELVPPLQFPPYIAAALFSAGFVRKAATLAFQEKGRSVTSPDIIDRIGSVFADLVPSDSL